MQAELMTITARVAALKAQLTPTDSELTRHLEQTLRRIEHLDAAPMNSDVSPVNLEHNVSTSKWWSLWR